MEEVEESCERQGFFKANKKFQEILSTILMMSAVIGTIFVPATIFGIKYIGDKVVKRVDKSLTLSETNTNNAITKIDSRVVVLEMDNAQSKVHNMLNQAKDINNKVDDIRFEDIEKAVRDYSTIDLNLFNSREQTDIRIAYNKIIKYYEDNAYDHN